MEIQTNLTRKDIVLAHIHFLHHTKSNIKMFLMYWAGVAFYFLFIGYRLGSVEKWIHFIIYCGFISVSLLIFVTMCILLHALILPCFIKGTSGNHEFKIHDEGLFEKTEAKETLWKWEKIKSIWKDDLFILVKLKKNFHVIPRRDFSAPEEFDLFYQNLAEKWGGKEKNT